MQLIVHNPILNGIIQVVLLYTSYWFPDAIIGRDEKGILLESGAVPAAVIPVNIN